MTDTTRTVAEAGEHRIIELIRSLVAPPPAWVTVGMGDDAAVVEPERNRLEVITTDVLVEGVHFDRAFCDPESIGYKALAVNLSDLAAMGAAPRLALLSLGLPAAWPVADLERMLRALLALANSHKVVLVGGNIARSPGPLFIDITLTGTCKRRRVLTRSGARAGDELYVTGSLGSAAAGLAWLKAHAVDSHSSDPVKEAVARFLRPEPRLRFGVITGRTEAASACMDLSDGLADAVRQMAFASGLGATVEADTLPVHPGATEIFHEPSLTLRAALSGGEDYELLLAVPRRRLRRFLAVQRLTRLPVTRIGALTQGGDVILRHPDRDEPMPGGFEHFKHVG
jgi:thiamine-monophosphate kinase